MKNGVYTALVTPFNQNNKVDYNALKKLIKIQINARVSGIVILGTTAESPTLSSREKRQIIEFVLPIVAGKLEVWVGCGTNSTATTLRTIKKLNKLPISGILLSLPAYNKPNFSGLSEHIQKCCAASMHPIMLYNVPGRTALNLSVNELIDLCTSPQIVAIKEASGNLELFHALVSKTNKKIFSGNDPQLMESLKLGGSGIVSVASNAFPKQMVKICNLFFFRHKAAAALSFQKLEPLLSVLFLETNPVPIKYILQKQEICSAIVRLPLGHLSEKSKNEIDEIIR